MGLHGESDALAREITDCARLMRHEGMRLVISTQSPKAMPEELLELTTILISHRFQSNDWHAYLAKKVPLPEGSFETIRSLAPGEALVYSARPCLSAQDEMGRGAEVIRVQVRKRLTADRGASRVNRKMHHPAGPSDAAATDQFAGSEDVTVEPQPSGPDPSGEIPWGEIATNSGVATNGGGGSDREALRLAA